MVNRLEDRITGALQALIGQRIAGVYYGTLQGEWLDAPAELAREFLYIGGEVELHLENGASVVVTWDENAGWTDHFSVRVSKSSSFTEGSLVRVDATRSAIWRPLVEDLITDVEVWGWGNMGGSAARAGDHAREAAVTPSVVIIRNRSSYGVVVASGQQERIGDGDDVLVMSEDAATARNAMAGATKLWHGHQLDIAPG